MYISYSPLRITFGGGGTDVEPFLSRYGGAVVNATIDRGVSVRYIEDEYQLELSSRDFVRSYIVNMHRPANVTKMMADFLNDSGITMGRVIMSGDAPPGSGLGSSSAAVSALMNLVNSIRGRRVDARILAEESYNLERDHFHVVLGKQDPYAIAYGGFKYMEFNSDGTKYENLGRYSEFTRDLQRRILLVYTGKTRQSSEVLMEQVKASEMGDERTNRSLLQMKDVAKRLRDAVINNDIEEFAHQINRGWEIKKALGSRITNEHIDRIISLALSSGAQAARLMGGGSQGFVLVLCRPENLNAIQKKMMRVSNFVVRTSFDMMGTRTIGRMPEA
ncbi:kinase [Thermoplasma sp.]|uniref:GHMP family kinase ATP-binding protein n=1 Tax=Thermoplasma sp. TaxID=1973142 RepID=UPI00126AD51F|nr:kinase [Thermoplasma sp.]KAA8922069.1 MAG: kinase [Thermoplasma sp.]